jgi:hypothetical protein
MKKILMICQNFERYFGTDLVGVIHSVIQEHRAMLASWDPIRNSLHQQDFPGMLSAGYFHPFSSRVAASVVGIDNDRESQRSGYQLPPATGQNSIKIRSFLREQKFFTSSKLQRLLLIN